MIALLVACAIGIAVLVWIDIRKRPVLYVLVGLVLVPGLLPGTLLQALIDAGRKPALQPWSVAFCCVVAAGLLGLAVRAVGYVRSTRTGVAAPARPTADRHADALPRLAVLRCTGCGSPLALSSAEPRCASCGKPYELPADYVATLALRGQVATELSRAELTWRRVQRASSVVSLPIYTLATLCAFFGLATLGGSALIGLLAALMLFVVGAYFATLSRHVPARPVVTDLGKPEIAKCRLCDAPLVFAAHDLFAACRYCGAEDYRAGFAHAERQSASREESAAASTLYKAVVELRRRVRTAAKVYLVMIVALVFLAPILAECVLAAGPGALIATVGGELVAGVWVARFLA